MRDALQYKEVRLLIIRESWSVVFHDMERDFLRILPRYADKVWKGSFAQLTFQVLPEVGLRGGCIFHDHPAIQPLLKAIQMNIFHGASTFAG